MSKTHHLAEKNAPPGRCSNLLTLATIKEDPNKGAKGAGKTRVLVAFDKYRSYEWVITEVIQRKRPHIEVASLGRETLATQVRRFDPHFVVSGQPRPEDLDGRLAWMRLSTDPLELSERCIGGERQEQRNPVLAELIWALYEAERLANAGHGPEGVC